MSAVERSPPLEPRLSRDTVVLSSFDPTGQLLDTIDVVPSLEDIGSIEIAPGRVAVHKRRPPFARSNHFALSPGGMWSSPNDRFELRSIDLTSGTLTRVVRVQGLERTATPEVAQSVYDQAMEEAEGADERSWLRTWFELSPIPDLEPAFDLLEVDALGRLWVREWTPSGNGSTWWVFAPEGDLLGSVAAPAGLTITDASCDHVLGVERDDLGVDYVVRYSLDVLGSCPE